MTFNHVVAKVHIYLKQEDLHLTLIERKILCRCNTPNLTDGRYYTHKYAFVNDGGLFDRKCDKCGIWLMVIR